MAVKESFKPEYLQLPQRLGFAWSGLQAKVGQINPAQAQQLYGYAEFRRSSVENLSRLLNELSGAAVSPAEYDRISGTQPNAGIGIFDGDDPVTFKAKMDGVIRDQKRAIARFNYLKTNGPQINPQGKKPWEVMGLDEIDKVINRRGAEIHRDLQKQHPKADKAVLDQAVRGALAKEFGIEI